MFPESLHQAIGEHAESEVHSLGIARTCDTFVIVVVVAVVEFENRTATFPESLHEAFRDAPVEVDPGRDFCTASRFSRGARSTRRRSAKRPKRGSSGITIARQEGYQDCFRSYPICPFASQTRSAEGQKSRAYSSTRAASSVAGSSPKKRTSE